MSSLIELHSDWLRPPHPTHLLVMFTLPPHTRLSCQSGRKIERQGILRYSPGARLWSFDWLNGFPKLLVLFHQLPLALNNLCQAEMRDRKVGRNWADELSYCGKFQTRVCWNFYRDICLPPPAHRADSPKKCRPKPRISDEKQLVEVLVYFEVLQSTRSAQADINIHKKS